MIRFESCEPFKAMVSDHPFGEEVTVGLATVVGFINNQPLVQRGSDFITWKYYKKIEPEYVPLDSTDEIPAWCVNRELYRSGRKFHRGGLVLKYVFKDCKNNFVCQNENGEQVNISLHEAAIQKLEITSACGHTFKFYKVKP